MDKHSHMFLDTKDHFVKQLSYSQTCVKQQHKGSTKNGCKGRLLLNRSEYQDKINAWEHFVWLLTTGWLLI